jgi:uncharacterized protein (DUF1015 family)
MPLMDFKKAIGVPNILLPRKSVDLTKWAIVACDQFTSQPSYWKELKKFIGEEPSTYELVLPEVFLEKSNDALISKINFKMKEYLDHYVFEDIGPSMMLIERNTSLTNRRLGLLMSINLDAYDYQEGTKPLIRTTEKTILNRIPPRVKIREHAPLELSHVMLLVDDPKLQIIENLYKRRDEFPKRYDFVLNMFGGHIKGYQINDCDQIIKDFYSLIQDPKNPLLFVAGDGNHSLATAKAHWEMLKKTQKTEDLIDHPAQYALVEVVNIYDEGLQFEGIHRVLFNTDETFITGLFHAVDREEETWIYTNEVGKTAFYIPKNVPTAYEEIQAYIDSYMERHPKVTIDYIHGDEELIQVCKDHPKSIGIKMPCMERSELVPYIQEGKVLPRKSFSMGCATAKRYYLESRFIIKNNQKMKGEH